MLPKQFAIQKKLRLVIHTLKTQLDALVPVFFANRERAPVNPRPIWNPLDQQAVPFKVRVWDFARCQQIVLHSARHRPNMPARCSSQIWKVRVTPSPIFAVKIPELPIAAIQIDSGSHRWSDSAPFLRYSP